MFSCKSRWLQFPASEPEEAWPLPPPLWDTFRVTPCIWLSELELLSAREQAAGVGLTGPAGRRTRIPKSGLPKSMAEEFPGGLKILGVLLQAEHRGKMPELMWSLMDADMHSQTIDDLSSQRFLVFAPASLRDE